MRLLKLGGAALRHNPARALLTSLATAAAVCVVVYVASGYDAVAASVDHYSSKALGAYPLSVGPIEEGEAATVPVEVVEALRADAQVRAAEPMWAVPVDVDAQGVRVPRRGRAGAVLTYRGDSRPAGPQVVLLGSALDASPFPLVAGRWVGAGAEAVVAAATAERLGLEVGDELALGKAGAHRLRVVGLADVPALSDGGRTVRTARILAPAVGDVFVTQASAEAVVGRPAERTFVAVSLADGVDLTAFRFGWSPRLAQGAVPVQFQEAHDIEEALDEAGVVDNMRLQAYAATGISLLVALLVVFSTLNMGVTERVRQFAVLRAIVLTRSEVAALIVIEALALGLIGWALGVALGAGLLQLTAWLVPALRHGAPVGAHSLTLSAIAALGGAGLAAWIPAYRATRVRPIDAMAPGRVADVATVSRWGTAAGLALVAVNPLLTFVFPPDFGPGALVALGLGFACMALGFVFLAPAAVLLADRFGSPLLARALRIEPRLIESQLRCHLWRTVGAALALSVGLTLYVAVQVWGLTMLQGFVPGSWTPDAMIGFSDGIPPQVAQRMARVPGVDPERCLPLVAEQPRLAEDLTGSAERASVTRQDNVVLVGLEPGAALGGEHPLLPLEWVAGSAAEAIPALAAGRGCVVPDHFLRETGLALGDDFALVPPEDPEQTVRYTIVGAVRLQGWHWQTKHTGLRSRTHRAAALVFAGYDAVAADFDLPQASHVWFAYAQGASPDAITAGAQALYAEHLGREVAAGRTEDGGPFVHAMPVSAIKATLMGAAGHWLWVVSQIPLIALCVAGVGVLNVILASVRARRWELGVVRALGFTGATLVRVVLAEGILIGAVACLLSLSFGILAGWCGCGLAQYMSFFGGMQPTLVVPWPRLLLGVVVTLTLSALAAAWPAAVIGRARPLTLIQEARGAF